MAGKFKIENIDFYKMEGAGNDFVVIDNRENKYQFTFSEFAKVVCRRTTGIGADGLIVLEKSDIAEFKMRYFNSDGSEGAMCGNGGRCVAQFDFMQNREKKGTNFESVGHVYSAQRESDNVRLFMKDPYNFKKVITITFEDNPILVDFINTGAPHVVVFKNNIARNLKDDLDNIDIIKIGKFIRYHDLFSPVGTNVNFVEIIRNGEIKIRTYERGVENETYACGTGAVASAIITSIKCNHKPPVKVHTKSSTILIVDFKIYQDKITDVCLIGPANIVFNGNIQYNFENNSIV